jgi:transcriptional regulator with XRE-family HTH domain
MAERVQGEPVARELIGARIHEQRGGAGLSIRAVSRRAGVTPSLISQIENGKVNPSVGTLYRLAEALEVPVDSFFRSDPQPAAPVTRRPAPAPEPLAPGALEQAIVTRRTRKAITLAGGVRWELLRPPEEAAAEDLEIMEVVYPTGSESASELISHCGREYGLVLEGRRDVHGEDHHVTHRPRDSIAFASNRLHRVSNPYDEPVRAVWFGVGRTGG